MEGDGLRTAGIGLLLVLVFVSGYRLTTLGRPFNSVLLTVHKLISLAAAALLIVFGYGAWQIAGLGGMEGAIAAVTALAFLGAIASGGVLSTPKPRQTAILRVHQTTSVLALLATAVMLFVVL